MKKHVFMIAAALLLGAISYAQTAGPRGGDKVTIKRPGQAGPGGQRGMALGQKKILDQLNLNASQKAAVEKLNNAQMEKMKAMRAKGTANGQKPDRAKFMAEAKAMRDNYTAQLKKILTAAQYKKFEDLTAKHRAEIQKRYQEGGQGKAGGPAKAGKAGKGGGR